MHELEKQEYQEEQKLLSENDGVLPAMASRATTANKKVRASVS